MSLFQRFVAGLKGVGAAIAAIPKDIKRYLAIRRM
jgi:hypothetical protein